MTVTDMSAAYKHAVHPLLESQQNVVWGNAGAAHHPNDPNVGRILQTPDPSQVSSSVRSPGAQEADDFGFEIV